MPPIQRQDFSSRYMTHAFTNNDQARAEVGADQWYIILYDAGAFAIVGTETGALIELKLIGYNCHLQMSDEFEMFFNAKVEVLRRIKEAQRSRAYTLKRANAKLRASLLKQLRALRTMRQRYDHLVESDLVTR